MLGDNQELYKICLQIHMITKRKTTSNNAKGFPHCCAPGNINHRRAKPLKNFRTLKPTARSMEWRCVVAGYVGRYWLCENNCAKLWYWHLWIWFQAWENTQRSNMIIQNTLMMKSTVLSSPFSWRLWRWARITGGSDDENFTSNSR